MDDLSVEDLKMHLGKARIDSLMASQCAFDPLELYLWELSLRQALIKPLALVEVILRNALDRALSEWWDAQGFVGRWTNQSESETLLTPFLAVPEWKRRARADQMGNRQVITHDDIIAHAPFGAWRNMIGNPVSVSKAQRRVDSEARFKSWEGMRVRDAACASLWRASLASAFPAIPSTKSARGKMSPRAYIGTRLSRISALRNRVCHCDNLLRINVDRRYQDMLEIVQSIDPALGAWFDDQCRDGILRVQNARADARIRSSDENDRDGHMFSA